MLMEQYPLILITVDMINSLLANENQVLAKPTYHQIIIVRNNTGLKICIGLYQTPILNISKDVREYQNLSL